MSAGWLYGSYTARDVANWAIGGLAAVYSFPDAPGESRLTMSPIPHTRGSGFDPVGILGTDWTIDDTSAVNDEEFLFLNLPETELTLASFQDNLYFDITPAPIEEGDRFRVPVGGLTLEVVDGTNYSGGPAVKASPYLVERFIKYMFGMEDLPNEERYLGLHDSGVEISGGGYSRYHFVTYYSFDSAQLGFYSLPSATIDGWGIYDAPTGGNLLLSGSYEVAQDVEVGDAFIHRIHAVNSFLQLEIL